MNHHPWHLSWNQLAQTIGKSIPFWTQGAGGNISVKHQGVLWIKGSGFRLDVVNLQTGIAGLELTAFLAKLEQIRQQFAIETPAAEEAYAGAIRQHALQEATPWGPETLARPSMEAGFHAELPKNWVLHFHALSAVLLAAEANQQTDPLTYVQQFFPQQKVALVSFKIPGLMLSEQLRNHRDADILLLENHGVVLQGDNPIALLDDWQKFEAYWKQTHPAFAHSTLCDVRDVFQTWSLPFANGTYFPIYFPDTAVFFEALTVQTLSNWKEKAKIYPELPIREKNLFELLWASDVLFRCYPALKELDLSTSAMIASLPVEHFRKKKNESHSS